MGIRLGGIVPPLVAGTAGLAVALAVIIGGADSQAVTGQTVTLGSTDGTPTENICLSEINCTYVPFSGVSAPELQIPFDGTVTSFSVNSAGGGGTVELRVLRPAASGRFTGVGTSPPEKLEGGANTFAVSIAVKAGDVLGLDNETSALMFDTSSGSPLTAYYELPSLAEGATAEPNHTKGGLRLLLSATVQAAKTTTTGTTTTPTGSSTGASPPSSVGLPVLSGTAIRGQSLAVSPGAWANSPGSFAYQWQSCSTSSSGCVNIVGANGAVHVLTRADVGHRLRAVVTASNAAGSAAATSTTSAVVGSRIEATASWTFLTTRRYAIVESLVVHGLAQGAKIELACHGGGCPFAHAHTATASTCHGSKCKHKHPVFHSEVSLGRFFKGRHLAVGAHFSISVVKTAWVGKSYLFTVRAGKVQEHNGCLAPASNKLGKGC